MIAKRLRPALAQVDRYEASVTSRRCFLSGAGATLALAPLSARANEVIKLPLPEGPDERPITTSQWRAEVEKMRTAYKAPIDPKDVDALGAAILPRQ
jgi:hypothetical protein